jgi:hypothetical protein
MQEACIRFVKNVANGSDGMDLGLIRFEGDNSAGTNVLYSYIAMEVQHANFDHEGGKLNWYFLNNGAHQRFLTMEGSSSGEGVIIFNRDGYNADAALVHDINFRIESTGISDMFFVDSGQNRIGIGTGTPTQTLELSGSFAGKVTTITGSTSSYTVAATDYTIIGHSTAAPCVTTLPACSAHPGRVLHFHQLDSGNLALTPTGGDTFSGFINGANQNTAGPAGVPQYQGITLISDGVSSWVAVGQSGPTA